jgi:hypothetical protein
MPKKTFNINKTDLYEMFIIKNMSRKEIASFYGCSQVLIKKKCEKFDIKKPKILENKNKERKIKRSCNWCKKEYNTVRFRTKNTKWMSKFCSHECSSKSRYLGESHKKSMLNSVAARRRAYMHDAYDETSDEKEIVKFYNKAKLLTEETGIPHEVDHIIPISRGGKHHQSNLQILTRSKNRRKHNKLCSEM